MVRAVRGIFGCWQYRKRVGSSAQRYGAAKGKQCGQLGSEYTRVIPTLKGYDADALQEQLEQIKKVAKNDPSMKDYIISSMYNNVIKPLDELGPNELLIEAGCQVLCMICDIAPEREDISRCRKELENVLLLLRVKNDENISERIKDLTGIAFRGCPCATCKIEETMVQ